MKVQVALFFYCEKFLILYIQYPVLLQVFASTNGN